MDVTRGTFNLNNLFSRVLVARKLSRSRCTNELQTRRKTTRLTSSITGCGSVSGAAA